jgi:hypothetical protein
MNRIGILGTTVRVDAGIAAHIFLRDPRCRVAVRI